MDFPEFGAYDALKTAMPFEHAEKLVTECVRNGVQELERFNQKYAAEHAWFEDGRHFDFVPMDNPEIDRVVAVLGRHVLVLLHRRGLIGS